MFITKFLQSPLATKQNYSLLKKFKELNLILSSTQRYASKSTKDPAALKVSMMISV